jgi:hypothetical protein
MEGKAYVKPFIQITRLRPAEARLSPFQMPRAGDKTKTPLRSSGLRRSHLAGAPERFSQPKGASLLAGKNDVRYLSYLKVILDELLFAQTEGAEPIKTIHQGRPVSDFS